jgi:hypothetical protein
MILLSQLLEFWGITSVRYRAHSTFFFFFFFEITVHHNPLVSASSVLGDYWYTLLCLTSACVLACTLVSLTSLLSLAFFLAPWGTLVRWYP